ncbi:thioesterase family protein [Halomonas sp. CUBES01]|uniref:Thioesterase family protein n=1 Tax=Vreelandella gomseomensis TaxID=370766 RepID=A0ABU1G8I9_9GAMM|nr:MULTISPECIES: thioesterase family protein [Halomonas]MDR5873813.1 thioesterase family protein [Halomonas gomseomensis]MEC4766889.1 thioesterase family protein [Halomonas sp. CUBES01]
MNIYATQVAAEWVDYNGHMNDAAYARVFSLACEALINHIGLDEAGREHFGYTLYTLETHLCYRREAHQGQSLSVDLTLLDSDAKRLHVFFAMRDAEGNLLATSEQMLMGMQPTTGRPSPLPSPVAHRVATLPQADKDAWPELAGRTIGIRR